MSSSPILIMTSHCMLQVEQVSLSVTYKCRLTNVWLCSNYAEYVNHCNASDFNLVVLCHAIIIY